jgi:hypothetical protein
MHNITYMINEGSRHDALNKLQKEEKKIQVAQLMGYCHITSQRAIKNRVSKENIFNY